MRLTETQLRKVIREELKKSLVEQGMFDQEKELLTSLGKAAKNFVTVSDYPDMKDKFKVYLASILVTSPMWGVGAINLAMEKSPAFKEAFMAFLNAGLKENKK